MVDRGHVPFRFQLASGEAKRNAEERKIGGESSLVSPFSQLCLAYIPIKCASGASGYSRKGLHSSAHSNLMRHRSAKQATPIRSTKNASGMTANGDN